MDRVRILMITQDYAVVRQVTEAFASSADVKHVELDGLEAVARQIADVGDAVVVVDHGLPWIDGLEVCAYTRRCSDRVAVVLYSDSASDESFVRNANAEFGVTHVLSRPLNVSDLRACISGGDGHAKFIRRIDTQVLLVDAIEAIDELDTFSRSVEVEDDDLALTGTRLPDELPVPDENVSGSAERYRLAPMRSNDPAAPQGIYGEQVLGSLIFSVYRDLFTGRLHLEHGGLAKTVFVRHGHPFKVTSSVRSEQLIWRLLLEERVDDHAMAAYRASVARGVSERDSILALGVVDAAALSALETRLAREAILQCFDWDGGRYGLAYDPTCSTTGDPEITPVALIFEGTQRSYPVAPLLAHFDDRAKRIPRTTERLRDYRRLLRSFADTLSIAELCDADRTLGEVLALSPLGMIDTLRVLLALETLQCLVYGDAVPTAQSRAPSTLIPPLQPPPGTAPRASRPSVGPRSLGGSLSTAPQAQAPSNSTVQPRVTEPRTLPPAAQRLSPASQSTEASVERVDTSEFARVQTAEYARIQGASNHYGVLGVARDAAPEAVRQAYARLSRLLAPERASALTPDVRERVSDALRRVHAAFEAIGDITKREQYDALEGAAPIFDGRADLVKAEQNFSRGKLCLTRGDNSRARAFFEVAAKQDAHTPAYRVYLAWSRFLCADAADARTRNEAREEIKAALSQDDRLEAGYVFLGIAARMQGNDELAERFFRKTLSLNSANQDAQRELRALDLRRKGAQPKDSLLGKLFTKKPG